MSLWDRDNPHDILLLVVIGISVGILVWAAWFLLSSL